MLYCKHKSRKTSETFQIYLCRYICKDLAKLPFVVSCRCANSLAEMDPKCLDMFFLKFAYML